MQPPPQQQLRLLRHSLLRYVVCRQPGSQSSRPLTHSHFSCSAAAAGTAACFALSLLLLLQVLRLRRHCRDLGSSVSTSSLLGVSSRWRFFGSHRQCRCWSRGSSCCSRSRWSFAGPQRQQQQQRSGRSRAQALVCGSSSCGAGCCCSRRCGCQHFGLRR